MMNTTQTQHTPKLNFHVAGHIKQLCDMVNSYSIQLGLGKKVRAQDFTDACAVALARDTASLVAENKRLRASLTAIISERDSAALADDPAYLMIDRAIESARAALSTEGRT